MNGDNNSAENSLPNPTKSENVIEDIRDEISKMFADLAEIDKRMDEIKKFYDPIYLKLIYIPRRLKELRKEVNGIASADGSVDLLRGLGSRAKSALSQLDIDTITYLVKHTPEELLRTHNFGRKSLNEIRASLLERGLHLTGDESYGN